MIDQFLLMKSIKQIIFRGVLLVFGSYNVNKSCINRPNIVWITSEDNEYKG